MADKIGVNRKWWQSPEKTSGSYYDICLNKKAKAIEFGAMNRRRKVTGSLGKPEDAELWLKNYMDDRKKLKEAK